MKTAIYLSGGGARGAYQAGVLKAVARILDVKRMPAHTLSSVSVGSINNAFLAMYPEDFAQAVGKINQLWANISMDKVFKIGNFELAYSIFRNIANVVFHFQPKKGGYLLDTSPLRTLLEENLDFAKINENIANNLVEFELAAACYDTAITNSFIYSANEVECWKKIRHHAQIAQVTCRHILASAALPLFFPSVEIDGMHYGDGGIRMASPLRASVNLGADKIFIIGTRSPISHAPKSVQRMDNISFATVLGTMLNALFLDNLDRDFEMLTRINESLSLVPKENMDRSRWRKIDYLCIRPEENIGDLAAHHYHCLPRLLRYLLTSFGSKKQSGDFLSFVLFESEFSQALIDLGFNDAMKREQEIHEFFTN